MPQPRSAAPSAPPAAPLELPSPPPRPRPDPWLPDPSFAVDAFLTGLSPARA